MLILNRYGDNQILLKSFFRNFVDYFFLCMKKVEFIFQVLFSVFGFADFRRADIIFYTKFDRLKIA